MSDMTSPEKNILLLCKNVVGFHFFKFCYDLPLDP